MAIKESREVVIEASPEEILDVIADFESMTQWSPQTQNAEVVERGDDGRPSVVKMKVKSVGVTDEQVVAYTWGENTVSWTLVSSTQQRSQDGSYTLTPEGADGKTTRVQFGITIDPLVPLPGFLLKRASKGAIEVATDGLRNRVLKVKKGQ
ncbi:MAG TPA: SRPBCC family protein [Mycobacterium sp.]|nr:SRPBCC family protein [Mycobacterium sp.]